MMGQKWIMIEAWSTPGIPARAITPCKSYCTGIGKIPTRKGMGSWVGGRTSSVMIMILLIRSWELGVLLLKWRLPFYLTSPKVALTVPL